jgi:peptidoglycan/xylan/chitin deacetylase (PgdA/CDA1 family)
MRSPFSLLALAAIVAASAVPACSSEAEPEPAAADDRHDDGAVTGEEDDLRQNLYKGSTLPPKTLAYTVDDGPNDGAGAPIGSGDNTRRIAEYLASQGVPATFFVLGKQITRSNNINTYLANKKPVTEQMDKLLKDIAAMPAGEDGLPHLIASHTFSHGDPMTALNQATRQAEMLETHKLLEPYYTNNIRLLRTPYGSWSPSVYDQLNAVTGASKIVGNIFWNAGGALDCTYEGGKWSCPTGAADWACWKPGKGRPAVPVEVCGQGYLNEIEGRAGKRGVILTHDIETKSLELAKWLIPRLKERGYTFVRLDQVPEINKDLIAAGAIPAPAAQAAGTPAPAPTPDPSAPPACREGTVLCGGVYKYGGEKGSLYKCVNGRLSIAYECSDECVKQASPNPDSCTRAENTGPLASNVGHQKQRGNERASLLDARSCARSRPRPRGIADCPFPPRPGALSAEGFFVSTRQED